MAKGKSQGKKNVLSTYSLAVAAMTKQVELSKQPCDTEKVMGDADKILISYLRSIGAHELVDKYNEVQRW